MVDQAHRDILDRETSSAEAQEHLGSALDLVREVVDYGSNLLVRCMGGTTGEILDVVAIGVFGKQAVAALDSVEQLARTGSGLGARVVMRALLEASMYCEWVLAGPDDGRARAYYVANLRSEISWSKRALPGTPEHERFRQAMGELYEDPLDDVPNGEDHVANRIAQVENHLKSEKFDAINSKFNDLRKGKARDPSWHRVAGAPTVRDVAIAVGRLAEYTIFYDIYSSDSHSGSYGSHLEVREGGAILYPIRSLRQIDEVLQNSLTFAFRTYRALLSNYRPDEIPAYNRLYITEWSHRYRSIPRISVESKARPSPYGSPAG